MALSISKVKIPLAAIEEAKDLCFISTAAFKDSFEKYGHYPPGIESIEWHQDKIETGIYHMIQYDEEIIGGLYLILHANKEMKIEYLFIDQEHQGEKIGTTVMALIEERYKEIKKWFLFTPSNDFGNHHFYEKLGYTRIGEIRPDENSEFKLFEYEKIIT